MTLNFLKKSREMRLSAEMLYAQAVRQAREPAFYASLGVPDSLDGRFDLVALHVFLLLHRLKAEGAASSRLAQRLFDTMFADMDHSLRELGVGDLGVGRRVKSMAKALYGRIAAYETGLAAGDQALKAALERNLYRSAGVPREQLAALCAYVRGEARALTTQSFESLAEGQVRFGLPPEASSQTRD